MPFPPALRGARGALAGALLLLPLAGCALSSPGVSCSGTSCSVTLSGTGSSVDVLGNSLAFAGTQDGRATLSVGDAEVSCTQGQRVSAGPLALTCTTIDDDGVELTASLG